MGQVMADAVAQPRFAMTRPATLGIVLVSFTAVSLLACWIPAARAARIHPSEALRYE